MRTIETLISAQDLSKTFYDFWHRPKAIAVDSISFQVNKGEIVGFLGPNGSGKSTTIKMMLNLLYPSSGKLMLFSKKSSDVNIKAKIGYLPEESYLYKYLTAEESLNFYGRLFGLPSHEVKKRTAELLEMAGLTHVRKRMVGEFSKGMARRIGVAQSLINNPELLILDEPTSGLDPLGCAEMKELILLLKSLGKTVLVCSHLLSDIEDVCDRVIILYGGKIVSEGKLNELLKISSQDIITISRLDEKQKEELAEFICKNLGQSSINISSPKMSLEKYFITLINEVSKQNAYTSGAKHTDSIANFLKKTV